MFPFGDEQLGPIQQSQLDRFTHLPTPATTPYLRFEPGQPNPDWLEVELFGPPYGHHVPRPSTSPRSTLEEPRVAVVEEADDERVQDGDSVRSGTALPLSLESDVEWQISKDPAPEPSPPPNPKPRLKPARKSTPSSFTPAKRHFPTTDWDADSSPSPPSTADAPARARAKRQRTERTMANRLRTMAAALRADTGRKGVVVGPERGVR